MQGQVRFLFILLYCHGFDMHGILLLECTCSGVCQVLFASILCRFYCFVFVTDGFLLFGVIAGEVG